MQKSDAGAEIREILDPLASAITRMFMRNPDLIRGLMS